MDTTLFRSGLGTDVSDCKTYKEVIEKAHLNYTVAKCPIMAKIPFRIENQVGIDEGYGDFVKDSNIYRVFDNGYCVYRTDINKPLGFVRERYTTIQNKDAFDGIDDLITQNKLTWVSAGYFGFGERMFVCAKITKTVDIGNADPIDSYLVFSNSHDGTTSINVLFTPIRVRCTNMVNGAIDQADAYIRFKHTENSVANFNNAMGVITQAINKLDNITPLFNTLYNKKITDMETVEIIAKTFLTEEELASIMFSDKNNWQKRLINNDSDFLHNNKISTRKTNIILNTYEYYQTDETQKEIIGTQWGAYNAITGYFSNIANLTGEKKIKSLLYGNANRIANKTLNMLSKAV